MLPIHVSFSTTDLGLVDEEGLPDTQGYRAPIARLPQVQECEAAKLLGSGLIVVEAREQEEAVVLVVRDGPQRRRTFSVLGHLSSRVGLLLAPHLDQDLATCNNVCGACYPESFPWVLARHSSPTHRSQREERDPIVFLWVVLGRGHVLDDAGERDLVGGQSGPGHFAQFPHEIAVGFVDLSKVLETLACRSTSATGTTTEEAKER